ncbi:quinolinate synthetase [Bifidobacterium margollesii]|uniref:Quinolinate synthase n=1 Tax=Bifidobacterium margollesii TaxID=2020964 RepID=A0A2N5J8T7_9BIFI|nr:quinolinate synthase NadA [Bifidobacterium margollesii]PLS30620.1 quinolinate synthetase [Bifidobacterium margollesii]
MTAAFTAPSVDEIIAKLGATSTCDAGLTQDPWHFDTPTVKPGYGPGANALNLIPKNAPRQQMLPEEYRNASDDELQERIRAAKARLGGKLLILGHFYQRDEIIVHADFVGDSFQLAKNATQCPDAEHIVFCGVHFMAETADILSKPEQTVTLPNLSAGCSMADMANIDQVEDCWEQLADICGRTPDTDGRQQIIPVTYMNSSAALKAFCGRNGGIVCTSSNAHAVLEWAFARGKRVLFFPDQHLGRNTARAMGIPLSEMPLWDPFKPCGGASNPDDYAKAKMILWKGFCSVHQRFTVDQIERARKAYPGVKVIVHPECSMQTVDAADGVGSTAYIVKEIANAPAGSAIAVGTEINLVNRLAAQYPDKTVFCLDPVVCPCSTMYRIHPAYLAWSLENIEQGNIVNRITVDDDTARDARVALERMLEVHP